METGQQDPRRLVIFLYFTCFINEHLKLRFKYSENLEPKHKQGKIILLVFTSSHLEIYT